MAATRPYLNSVSAVRCSPHPRDCPGSLPQLTPLPTPRVLFMRARATLEEQGPGLQGDIQPVGAHAPTQHPGAAGRGRESAAGWPPPHTQTRPPRRSAQPPRRRRQPLAQRLRGHPCQAERGRRTLPVPRPLPPPPQAGAEAELPSVRVALSRWAARERTWAPIPGSRSKRAPIVMRLPTPVAPPHTTQPRTTAPPCPCG